METDHFLTLGRCIKWALVTAIVAVPVLLLPPAVQQARESERRSQSRMNLKLIGLALHNYHETHEVFPPGGVFSADGAPFHCWTTLLQSYLEAIPGYMRVDFKRPWDDPDENFDRFLRPTYTFNNPGVSPARHENGLSLAHYAGSDRILYRNSSVRLADLTTGAANVMLAAESFGNYPPLGLPYNWRDPSLGLRTSRDGFGYEHLPATQVLLCDGSAKSFDREADPAVVASLAGPEELRPTDDRRARPNTPYVPPTRFWRRTQLTFRNGTWADVRMNPDGEIEFVWLHAGRGKFQEDDGPQPGDAQLAELAAHPTIHTLASDGHITDDGVRSLNALPALRTLMLSGRQITDTGLRNAEQLMGLRSLSLLGTSVTASGIAAFRRTRPECELSVAPERDRGRGPNDVSSE